MRIAFVIPSLGAGGAERVASLLANDWSANGHEVTLVTFDAPGTEPFFALHPGIALRGLAAPAEPRGLRRQARHQYRPRLAAALGVARAPIPTWSSPS